MKKSWKYAWKISVLLMAIFLVGYVVHTFIMI